VAALVTNNPERRAQAQRDYPAAACYSSADELWHNAGQYDLAVIATPNRYHVPLGIAAMEAGLSVVIDKPVAASSLDAATLLDASARTGRLLTVFQNRRWDGDFLTVRQLLTSDALGTVTRFESRFERYRSSPRMGAWRELPDREEAGGLLYDLGSHLVDQAIVLFGSPVQVYAECEARRPARR